MADLAAAGAVGFSDDGLPIRSARVMRRALQYQRLVGLPIALHEEDPELSAGGSMHEGEVSAMLGIAGIPVGLGVDDDRPRLRARRLTRRPGSTSSTSRRAESVAAIEAAKAAGVRVTCEATPHHLTLTDEEVRSLDSRFKMNPPLRTEADRQALIEGIRSGAIDCIATDHAPHTLEREGGAVRAGGDGRDRARDRVRRSVYTDLVLPGVLDLGDRGRAAGRRRRAVRPRAPADRAGRRGQPDPLRPRRRVGGRARRAGRAARTTRASPAASCAAGSWSRSPPAGSPTGSARFALGVA